MEENLIKKTTWINTEIKATVWIVWELSIWQMHIEGEKSHEINKAYEQSICWELITKAKDLDERNKIHIYTKEN